MIDGRHTGTGGGNHVDPGRTVGRPTRRCCAGPICSKSLLGYWLNHPSLSYLFSGLFIGPTSQHPRVDEARNDALHELEIAFRRDRSSGEQAPPWLVDRIFRNLLVDATGNTHRTEFCIDKLFTPDAASGRRRPARAARLRDAAALAHERGPAGAAARPGRHLLGSALRAHADALGHASCTTDFMLPHFVWQDFADVLRRSLRGRLPTSRPDWFAPYFEFRFPSIGDRDRRRGIELELRSAIEPWHRAGRGAGVGGGTARYVDSSVERLQVKRGRPDRAAATSSPATARARAAARHRTVGDIRRRRALPRLAAAVGAAPDHRGPCAARVRHPRPLERPVARRLQLPRRAHPGGRSYDRFPVNANEAEARRVSRFEAIGHTPGPVDVSTWGGCPRAAATTLGRWTCGGGAHPADLADPVLRPMTINPPAT